MRNVPLTMVHVVPPIKTLAEDWSVALAEDWPEGTLFANYAQLQNDNARQLVEAAHKAAVEATTASRAPQMTTEFLHGHIEPTLVDLSRHADMVVVGCRGMGAVEGALLGSVSSGVAHHAQCPVAVIHDDEPLAARSLQAPVVVGIDGSPTSELATEIALDEASRRGVGLVAVHAWTDMGPLGFPPTNWAPIEWRNIRDHEEEVLSERLSGWQERYPDVAVDKIVVSDRPAPRLLEHAQAAQLVVVGSHGRGGFPGMLLGSVSRAVVQSARVPVIVARMPHD